MDMEWTKTTDVLPKIGVDEEYPYASEIVLLSDGEDVFIGMYEETPFECDGFIDPQGDEFENVITHWMPLPEPPNTK